MFYVWYVVGAGSPREESYPTKRAALNAIFAFNAMKQIQRIKHPKNGAKLYLVKRSK